MIKITEHGAIVAKSRRASGRRRRGGAVLPCAAALLALGTLVAPSSARPFEQYLNGACGAKICTINFAKVPAGQRLEVTNVSCYIRLKAVPGRPSIRAVQLLVLGANSNNAVSATTVVPFFTSDDGFEVVHSANQIVTAFANAQQRFQAYVEISSGVFSQVACHIGGDLVPA